MDYGYRWGYPLQGYLWTVQFIDCSRCTGGSARRKLKAQSWATMSRYTPRCKHIEETETDRGDEQGESEELENEKCTL